MSQLSPRERVNNIRRQNRCSLGLNELFEFQTKSIGVLNRKYGRYDDEMTICEFFYRS